MNAWKVKWEDVEPMRSGKSKDGSTVCAVVPLMQNVGLSHFNIFENKRNAYVRIFYSCFTITYIFYDDVYGVYPEGMHLREEAQI